MKILKSILVLISIICFAYSGYSQTIEKFSIDSGGNSITNGTIQLLFTIGEVNVQETSLGNIQLSEGFINPEEEGPTLSNESEVFDQTVLLYPNPTSDIVNVKSNQSIKNIKLYTLNGQLILELTNSNQIQCNQLASGMYLINVLLDNQLIVKRLIIN